MEEKNNKVNFSIKQSYSYILHELYFKAIQKSLNFVCFIVCAYIQEVFDDLQKIYPLQFPFI